ncbi:zinc-dependent alcohol dehydrogenase family protein [Subtercola boreus]|uniref:IMP dehydrogenase n=1 Tax=Subtercola boreus TaxID=120213 RepID=A0A3E0W9N2_9MICO|nr:zinc-dependent alcohol dehydrogenase family protein [Subtercola boreus]RFA20350.1 IMP dehydrogenase [Subtercola boreus]RFA20504.1 IMP dehydrogenase [Subtercola boreus]RFA26753.1 IMP dehydrogenase [Subtercola boreus]
MRAAVYNAPFDVSVETRPDPVIQNAREAIVRVTSTCVCGSDLWYYRGESKRRGGGPIGHEFLGVVEEIGGEVTALKVGDFVIAPFMWSDGTCAHCLHGITSSCVHGGFWAVGTDGGQGQYVRVPEADGTLVVVPGGVPDARLLPSLLTLSDVMGTGHHAAVSAGVVAGSTVAVVGDGAVGLCGVLAARRLGAERIIALSRNPGRQAIATAFGATDIISSRGDDAVAELHELTGGVGADATLECVGTAQAFTTAFAVARPGSRVGFVGVPHGVEFPLQDAFTRNIGLGGGVAPVRAYLPALLDDVLNGSIEPGLVFDYEFDLENIGDAYAAMDGRRAIKAIAHLS